MSSYDRRTAGALILSATLAGCGFRPIHRESSVAEVLRGQVRVESHEGRAGFYLVRTLQQRLGLPEHPATWSLEVRVNTRSRNVVIGLQDEVVRYNIDMLVDYTLQRIETREIQAADRIQVTTAVNTTGSPFAAYVAERERIRIAAVDSADRVLRDIHLKLALAEDQSRS